MYKYSLNNHFQDIDDRVARILAFPGISNKELLMRKNYWYATIVCMVAVVILTLLVLLLPTSAKVLIGYGIMVIAGQILTVSIFLLKPRKIMWLMISNLY